MFDATTAKGYETLLEKKWTSIVRLQKKACLYSGFSTLLTTPAHHFNNISKFSLSTDNGP